MIPSEKIDKVARHIAQGEVPLLVWLDNKGKFEWFPATSPRAVMLKANPPPRYRVLGVFSPADGFERIAKVLRGAVA